MPAPTRPHPQVLSFKNSFQLFLDANLGRFFAALEEEAGHRFIADRLRKWRLHHVEEVYLMVPAGMEPSRQGRSRTAAGEHFLKLEAVFQRNGLRVYLTPLASLTQGDFDFQTHFNRTLTRSLKKHPVTVLFLEESRDAVEVALATMLLTGGNGLAPEKALRYVSRRTEITPADGRLYEYKKYLDPNYVAPERNGRARDLLFATDGTASTAPKTDPTTQTPPKTVSQSGSVPSGSGFAPDSRRFAGCEPLYLEAALDEYFAALGTDLSPGNDFVAGRLRDWRPAGIRTVFLMVPAGLEPSRQGRSATSEGEYFLALERIFQNAGLRVYLAPLAGLSRSDFRFQHQFNSTLAGELERQAALVLYRERDAGEVFGALAPALLGPGAEPTPEQALQALSQEAGQSVPPRLLEFQQSLGSEYRPPLKILEAKANPVAKETSTSPPPTTATTTAAATPATTAAKTEATPAASPPPTTPVEAKPPAAAPPPAPPPASPPKASSGEGPVLAADPNFSTGKFSIKVKMVGIISTIILLALGAMVLVATYFFSEDSTTRVEENNLALTEVIGGRVESEFENLSYKGLLLATNLIEGNAAQQKTFTDLFFRKNGDIVFIGIAENRGGSIGFVREQFNETFLADKQIDKEAVRGLAALGGEAFRRSFSGGTVVRNVSPGFPEPVLGLSLPFNNDRIVVMYLYLNEDPETGRFLKSFAQTGIATAYLIDSDAKIIAHPNLEEVNAGADYSNVPIVSKAFESTNANGLAPYEYKGHEYLGSFRKLNFANLYVISSVDKEQALKAVQNIQNRNLVITAIVVLASVLIVFFFARTISVPILALVDATRQVESGDYAVSIEPAARDEVGELTNSFVQMASGLAERERVKDALGKFVNKEIAELASAGKIALGGERKQAAVFFSDLRGFTAMSEGRTPEEVVSILNEYFTAMVATIEETHGVVDKFIGDAIMAHWGAVKSVGNDTENAINAGLMMRKALMELNERNQGEEARPYLKMGSGINTGPVISGQIGSDNRFEFTVIGDAVNLASRIEALNKPFGTDLLISQDSYDLVKDIFNVEPMPAIKVKGKSEPQTIYAILGRKDDPDCPKSLDEVRAMLGIEYDEAKAGGGEEKEVKYEILEKK